MRPHGEGLERRGGHGVGTGLAGILATQLHCPVVGHEHQLLGHATVALACLLVGAIGWAALRKARG